MKVWKILWITFYIALIVIAGWAVVSYIDIIWDNLSPNPTHFKWNLFTLIAENAR